MAVTVDHLIQYGQVFSIINGPVRTDLLRRGILVVNAAKTRIGHSPKRVDTGRLRSSIGIEETQAGGSISVVVGTGVEYAIFVHEGTIHMEGNPFLVDGLKAAKL